MKDKELKPQPMKEQIEEMAKILSEDCGSCENCKALGSTQDGIDCTDYYYARKLYHAGYRKQSEGEWIGSDQTDEYICSLCGGIAPVDCEKEDFYKSNFCPNCGAHMKGGAE